jgi:hypothetical protein
LAARSDLCFEADEMKKKPRAWKTTLGWHASGFDPMEKLRIDNGLAKLN